MKKFKETTLTQKLYFIDRSSAMYDCAVQKKKYISLTKHIKDVNKKPYIACAQTKQISIFA